MYQLNDKILDSGLSYWKRKSNKKIMSYIAIFDFFGGFSDMRHMFLGWIACAFNSRQSLYEELSIRN